jgi:hypothetical protein
VPPEGKCAISLRKFYLIIMAFVVTVMTKMITYVIPLLTFELLMCHAVIGYVGDGVKHISR